MKPVLVAIAHDPGQLEQVQELAERLGAKLLTLSPRSSAVRRRVEETVVPEDWSQVDPLEPRFAALIERLDALAQRT